MNEFRTKLLKIGQELTSNDLHQLKYLCKDIIPAGKAELISRPLELFQELERVGKLSEDNPHFLAECLTNIRRNDLKDRLLVAEKSKEKELSEKFHTKLNIKQFEIFDGDTVVDGGNTLQAHLAVITSKDQVKQVLDELKKKDPDVAKATHNIWAYRIFDAEKGTYDENCDDDGDDSSGARVLRFLKRTRATDVMVVVSCWYETTAEDFGEVRFKCIQKSVLDLFLTYRIVKIPTERIKKFYEEIKYTPFEKTKEQETPKFDILHGEPIEDRKSTFQAHIADIISRKQVDQVLEELKKDRKIAKATYNMWAFRVYDEKKKSYFEEGNDDGENLGGERLLHLLQRSDAKNVVIIVTRWHGGIHLGNDRFKHINKCASDLLKQWQVAGISTASPDSKDVVEGARTTIQEKMKPKCILKTAIGEAPQTDNVIRKLKILLDPPRALGGDIRSLASAFGYTNNEIQYLTKRPSTNPTEDLLQAKGDVTIEFLLEKLVFIGRNDAAEVLRDYVTMQDCKCDDCRLRKRLQRRSTQDASEISVGEKGGSYDVSRNGIALYFPPNSVAKHSVGTCSVHSKDYSPSPAGAGETLVSNIVDLGPGDVDIRQPIKVTIRHSGTGKDLGYETVVKTFNKEKDVWEEIEELNDKSSLPEHSIQVEIKKLATLAVVTRLITDRFQVTPKGSVVKSSVCDDVIVEFPEGAVDKTVEGSLKLMLMPEIIPHAKDACPILCMDGFSNITFSKPVIVKMPIPDNRKYSTNEIRLLRLEDNSRENNKWEDVTHEAKVSQVETHIEFHVERFSSLWPWIKEGIQFASEIFQYISCSSPEFVCFAAFKFNEEASRPEQKLTLVCVVNHPYEQHQMISTMEDEHYSKLAVVTSDRSMRPNDEAYLKINGADVRHVDRVVVLRFLKSQVCRKELILSDQRKNSTQSEENENNSEAIVVDFFPMPAESQSDLPSLCTLQIIKDEVFPGRGGPEGPGNPSDERQPEVQEQAQPEGIRDLISCAQGDKSLFTKVKEFIKENLDLKTDDFFAADRHVKFALDYPYQLFVSDAEETLRLKRSVGAINAINISDVAKCGATCFRIGTKYVITNKHVVDEIKSLGIQWSRCYVDFNYQEPSQQPADNFRFKFAANPERFSSEEQQLDYAILELNPEGRNLPPSLVDLDSGFNIAPPHRQLQDRDCLTFMGHPGGLKKQIDFSCPIKFQPDIQNPLPNHLVPMIQNVYNHPDYAGYNVSTFFKGSSGSPGLLRGEKLLVVLHCRGIPFQGTNKSYALEYGPLMSSVVKDVMRKINNPTIELNVTRVLNDIFGGLTSSTFIPRSEPMETD